VLALAACGGSGASKDAVKITIGRTGGMVPYAITILPGGTLKTTGVPPAKPTALTSAQDETFSLRVKHELGSYQTLLCGHTFPDEASYFITALGRTVAVRGSCEPGFTKLWDDLANALGLNS
jgi:hypothetical protein